MQAPFRGRTTTGCSTCRMRRKKCDEKKPTCSGCSRNHLICRWRTQERTYGAPGKPRHRNVEAPNEAEATSKHVAYYRILPNGSELRTSSIYKPAHPLMFLPVLHRELDRRLLDHYLQITSAQLSGRVEPRNPFLDRMMPVAYADNTVLQSILAVSGAQLHAKSDGYEHSARSHYAVSLRSVKHSLLHWQKADTTTLTTLLAATLLLGFFEVVIGDITGSFNFHLKASRIMLLELRERRMHHADKTMLDLFTEIYAYFAITTNITLHPCSSEMWKVPQDAFLSPDVLCSLSRGTENYGVQFGAAHELFAMINPITRFMCEPVSDPNGKSRTTQLLEHEARILSWKYNPALLSQLLLEHSPDPYKLAGQVYKHAVLIYLYTTFHSAQPPTPALVDKIEPHVIAVFTLCHAIPRFAAIQTTHLWPVLIAGSCLRDTKLQANILAMLQRLPYTTGSIRRMFEFLSLLWEEMGSDGSVYGPWGIEKTIVKTGFRVCCA